MIKSKQSAFTIVELIVVIVVIGILATISITSYGLIQSRAATETLKLDVQKATSQIASYKANTGGYPATGAEVDDGKGLSKSTDTTYEYTSGDDYYCLEATSTQAGASTFYSSSSNNGSVGTGTCPLDPVNWLTIGSQVWAKYNLNVGTRINGAVVQTNNGGTNEVEKYCYDDLEANCTANNNGGLYRWDEAMQYVTTEGAQGICPAGSHIPSDNDIKILEMQLGMSQAEADAANYYRGTDQGDQLKPGGTSGLNMPFAGGSEYADGSFFSLSQNAGWWSSTESSASAWSRDVFIGESTVLRTTNEKGYGFSVRCLGN